MTARQSAREERGAEGKTEREPTAGHKTGTPVQLMNKEERDCSPKNDSAIIYSFTPFQICN